MDGAIILACAKYFLDCLQLHLIKAKNAKNAKNDLATSTSIIDIFARDIFDWGIFARSTFIWGLSAQDAFAKDLSNWGTCASARLYSTSY